MNSYTKPAQNISTKVREEAKHSQKALGCAISAMLEKKSADTDKSGFIPAGVQKFSKTHKGE